MSSIHDVLNLCDQYDLIFLQETWLFKHELSILNNLHVQFGAFGCSAIDDSNGIVRGRPYGGLGVLIRKSFRPIANFHTYDDSRLLGITIKSDRESLYFFNTYLPYQCDDNYDVYVEYLGKIVSIVDESPTSHIMVLGDFNAAVDTLFETELLEMCRTLNLIISDYNVYGRESGEYTYVSDAHNTTSWLDHALCSHDMNTKLSSLRILNKFPSSDHLPVSIYLHFDHPIEELVTNSCSRDKVTINWSKASDCDILYYRNLTYNYLHQKTALANLQRCIQEVREWLRENFLLLNENKTEVVIFGKDTTEKQLQIGKSVISSISAATSLGCILDSKLNMSQHVSRLCKSANYYLHCIRKIRNFISMDACKLLVHTLVMVRLDYCNALLCGAREDVIRQLERLQRQAARVVCKKYKNDHTSVTELMWGLHWLPIRARIQYKILLLVYKAFTNGSPTYLADMMTSCNPVRSTRSSHKLSELTCGATSKIK